MAELEKKIHWLANSRIRPLRRQQVNIFQSIDRELFRKLKLGSVHC